MYWSIPCAAYCKSNRFSPILIDNTQEETSPTSIRIGSWIISHFEHWHFYKGMYSDRVDLVDLADIYIGQNDLFYSSWICGGNERDDVRFMQLTLSCLKNEANWTAAIGCHAPWYWSFGSFKPGYFAVYTTFNSWLTRVGLAWHDTNSRRRLYSPWNLSCKSVPEIKSFLDGATPWRKERSYHPKFQHGTGGILLVVPNPLHLLFSQFAYCADLQRSIC
jgi:hypothetical protein